MQSPRIPARTQLSGRYNPTTPVIDPPSVFNKFRRHSGRRAIRALPICPETHRGTGHPLLIFPECPCRTWSQIYGRRRYDRQPDTFQISSTIIEERTLYMSVCGRRGGWSVDVACDGREGPLSWRSHVGGKLSDL